VSDESDSKDEVAYGTAVVALIVGIVAGFFLAAGMVSADNALDRVCYQEVGPDYTYSVGSAQYWNGTLTAECVKVPAEDSERRENVQLGDTE